MQTNKITVCKNYWPFDIKKVEEKYNAKYIGDFALKDKYNGWTEQPAAIFYCENPDQSKGHTHYFGLLMRGKTVMITKGDSAFSQGLSGAIAKNGEIIISCYRHHFVEAEDGSCVIDGGRDYLHTNTTNIVKLKINKDKLEIEI